MSEKGLKMLIERLKDYIPLKKINVSGNELNEEELRLMKENQEVFECLEELSITLKENLNKSELKSFLKTFSSIGIIKLNGISEEEKKEISEQSFNII